MYVCVSIIMFIWAPVDNYHQECWSSAGQCRDNGASVCSWCGIHEGAQQYCCASSETYGAGHACENAIFSSAAYHHCVTSGYSGK